MREAMRRLRICAVTTRRYTRLSETQEWKSLSRGASPERLWGISERASVRLVFLFLGGFLLGCHEVFPPLNDLFSQGSRQGTLMPELLNFLYEQLSYHKILPLVCNLSMKILLSRTILVKRVLRLRRETPRQNSPLRQNFPPQPVSARCLCDNFRKNLCPITKFSAQN